MITTMNIGSVARSRRRRGNNSTLLGSPLRILLGEGEEDPGGDFSPTDEPSPSSDLDPNSDSSGDGGEPSPEAEKSMGDQLSALGAQGADLLKKYGGDAKKAYQAAQSLIPGLPNIPGVSKGSSGGTSSVPGSTYYLPTQSNGGISALQFQQMQKAASNALAFNRAYKAKTGSNMVLKKYSGLSSTHVAIGIVAIGAIAFILL